MHKVQTFLDEQKTIIGLVLGIWILILPFAIGLALSFQRRVPYHVVYAFQSNQDSSGRIYYGETILEGPFHAQQPTVNDVDRMRAQLRFKLTQLLHSKNQGDPTSCVIVGFHPLSR